MNAYPTFGIDLIPSRGDNGKTAGRKTGRSPGAGRLCALALVAMLLLSGAAAANTLQGPQPFPFGVALMAPVQYPAEDVSVTGFRFSLFYGRNAEVMGLDIGALVSAADGDVFGMQISGLVNNIGSSSGTIQFAGIANNCYEDFCGCQLSGIANRAGGTVQGGQIGCFNLAGDLSGIQIGVYNKAANSIGLQIGVVNETSSMQGIQIGLINMIRQSPVPFCPIFNMYF